MQFQSLCLSPFQFYRTYICQNHLPFFYIHSHFVLEFCKVLSAKTIFLSISCLCPGSKVISTFKQPKRHNKLAALVLLLSSEAATEDKTNTCADRPHPTYHRTQTTSVPENVESCCIKKHHNQHRRRRRIRTISNEKGSLDSFAPQVCFTPLYSVNCMCVFLYIFLHPSQKCPLLLLLLLQNLWEN